MHSQTLHLYTFVVAGAAAVIDPGPDWVKYLELGAVSLILFMVLYYDRRYHIPKILDQQTESNKLFEKSLDTITERHEAGMREISHSLNQVSGDLVNIRETVAGCKEIVAGCEKK